MNIRIFGIGVILSNPSVSVSGFFASVACGLARWEAAASSSSETAIRGEPLGKAFSITAQLQQKPRPAEAGLRITLQYNGCQVIHAPLHGKLSSSLEKYICINNKAFNVYGICR